MKSLRLAVSIMIALLLSGCGGHSQKVKELQKYMEEVKSRPTKQVEPIPDIAEFQKFAYQAGNLRSPFKPPEITPEGSQYQPDINRQKEKLEAFPLDALRMVGTLNQQNKVWALISAPDGAVYRVTLGSHMGQNYGEVMKITKDKVYLKETVPNNVGGWKKRDITMSLDK
ncbi:MAG: pilus assembly protein PilP [Legionellales bacterium]|nr:pilus assembly protein PilP [Legionellales bacterium]|tara:strand:+ start:17387 stop:17896 length:510 start_codon:yes stop_codon:yes gene_type:complete